MNEITVKVTSDTGRKFLQMYYDDPTTGKRHKRSTRTTKQRDADRAAAKWEAELREDRYKPEGNITWQSFRERCEDEKLAALSRASQNATTTAFNHFERIISPKYLRVVTSAIVSRFQAELRREGMPDTSIACHLRNLRAALNWAEDVGLIAKAPKFTMPGGRRGKKTKQRMMRGRPITLEEFERMLGKVEAGLILYEKSKRRREPANRSFQQSELDRRRRKQAERAAAAAPSWLYLLRGLWLSGLRLGEAVILSWDQDAPFCVDLSGRFPRFRIYGEAQKSGEDEFLPMTPDFAEFLAQTPEDQRHGYVFNVQKQMGGIHRDAEKISPIISAIGRAAGVVVNKDQGKYASAHDLRRAFGTRWAPKVKPATLQRLMRHKSIETTLKYYVAQDADDIAAELWGDSVPTFVPTSQNRAHFGRMDHNPLSTETRLT